MITELTTSSVALAVQELSKEKKKSTSWWERRPRPSRQRLLSLWPIGLSTPTRSRSVGGVLVAGR